MIRWLTLALLLLTSAAYAGQGMGPGPGYKTYVVAAGTPLTAASFTFTSDDNGGGDSASDATGVIESVTGHTGSAVSAWRINMGFYNNDIVTPDYTAGSIYQTVTIPAGGKRISFWVKGSASSTYASPRINDVDITPITGAGYYTTGSGWEQATTDVVAAGTYTFMIKVYYPSYSPIYIADISLVAP